MAAIYQAEIWCDCCAELIRERLDEIGTGDIDTTDEASYDSDEYPKHADDDEEADSPQHCAAGEECVSAVELPSGQKIGCLIGTSLTSDGVEYVRQAVAEGGEVAGFWAEEFADYDVSPTRTMSFGVLPTVGQIRSEFPAGGYEIEARGQDWQQIVEAVNPGIDSHLEAVFFDQYAGDHGRNGIRIRDPKSLLTLVRRLTELDSENADSLASGIMETLNIEWV